MHTEAGRTVAGRGSDGTELDPIGIPYVAEAAPVSVVDGEVATCYL